MSIRDYKKVQFTYNYNVFSIKQLKNIVKKLEKELKTTNIGEFSANLIVSFNDRDSGN